MSVDPWLLDVATRENCLQLYLMDTISCLAAMPRFS